ncbi:MAG: c-type cytochrome, partial [Verrucomicrobiales bacterium]|nr:c-type cytochrome [Verrucomicrobiales bacterium]
ALARLGFVDNAGSITAVLGDSDPVVAHTAVQAMIHLKGVNACLPLVDHAKATSAVRTAALRVLQGIPQPEVVEALLQRLAQERRVDYRPGLITALCRLHFVEGQWKGDSWGTRPDTRGPFYQPEPWSETPRIAAALKNLLEHSDPAEADLLSREMARHRIPVGDALEKLITRAATDATLLAALASQVAAADSTPDAAVPLLAAHAVSDAATEASRAESVIALARAASPEAWRAILAAHPRVQQAKSENNLVEKARQAVFNASRLELAGPVLAEAAARADGDASQLAEVLLLKLAAAKVGAPEARALARLAVDDGWKNPKRRTQILRAAARARDTSRATQIVAALEDPDPEVAKAAQETVRQLRLDPAQVRAAAAEPKIGDLPPGQVLDALLTTRGQVARGEQLFTQLSCVGCHTTLAGEALKGPYLGTIATLYKRRDLAEAILTPNKTLAQGFITHHFELKDGTEHDGFVVQEAADVVTIRNVSAQEVKIAVSDVARRERQERSLMPEGLAAGLTVGELASLIDFLESLPAKNAKP